MGCTAESHRRIVCVGEAVAVKTVNTNFLEEMMKAGGRLELKVSQKGLSLKRFLP